MDLREFRLALSASAPPPGASELLQALWYDAKGDWARAHELAQGVKDKTGARVHAYLHRKEGDLDNAGYWHERAGTAMPDITLEQEWETLAVDLLEKGNTMTDIDASTQTVVPAAGLVTLTHVMYALHAFSAVTGLMTAALIVTAFLTGWPSIIAVIMNYVKRGQTSGTFLDSHFGWQLRTFWFALLWVVISWLLIVTIIGVVIGVPMLLAVGIWVLYRIIRGWLALVDRKPMPM